ncbi:MAG: hypothetical protein JXQ96_23250 [Cyclobacteriaceae bacterium]
MKYILVVVCLLPFLLTAQSTQLTVTVSHPDKQYATGIIQVVGNDKTLENELVNGQANFILSEILDLKVEPIFEILAYPNPSYGQPITLKINKKRLLQGNVTFYDLTGKTLGHLDVAHKKSLVISNTSNIVLFKYSNSSGPHLIGKILTNNEQIEVNADIDTETPQVPSTIQSSHTDHDEYAVTFSDPEKELATIRETIKIEDGTHKKFTWNANYYSRLIVNNGSGSGRYDFGEIVPIKAKEAQHNYAFEQWTGDTEFIADIHSPETSISITSEDVSVTAEYQITNGKIQLPIEVMGAPGHIEEVILNLGENGNAAEKLWVRVHNISYNGKGRLRVNEGDWHWLSNNNSNLILNKPDKAYGGFGGGFSTITFALSNDHLEFVDGENKIEFEYNHRNGPTAGYRVIDLNILDANGNKIIAPDVFVEDDPHSWQPILTDSEDIERGEWLWKNYNLGIEAKCSNCHTESGMDLKYFNVSNKTIVEQAKKSNLTQIEGEQIASYIRSHPMTSPKQARVYNPPYQPGSGTDSMPVFEWAAGAGLGAVLDKDEDMLPYIFGDGSRAAIDASTDIRTDLNLREIPVAVQFPDWLHWIPRINPVDIWGKNTWLYSNGHNGNNNAEQAYKALKRKLDTYGAEQLIQRKDLIETLEKFARDVMWWVGHDNNTGHPWTATIAPMLDQRKTQYTAEQAKHNLALWQNMKLWEVMMEYELQDKADDERATAEKYNWPINRFSMFIIPAHFTGDNRGTSHFAWESQVVGTYYSSIWYQVQITVNSGMRSGYNVAPSDWSYNLMHINLLGERTGIYEPLRYYQNMIKAYQQRDKGINDEINISGWTMREVSPWRAYSNYKGDQQTMELLNNYRVGLRADVTSSILSQWLRKSNEYDLDKWPRTSTIGFGSDVWFKLEFVHYDPTEKENPGHGKGKLFAPDGSFDAVEAHAFYRLLDGSYNNGENRLEAIGVDKIVILGLAQWADSIWVNPDTDWFNWRE